MPRAGWNSQGAGGLDGALRTLRALALLHIGGGEFEIIRKPDLTRGNHCAMASFHVEDQDRGAGLVLSDPDEAQWRLTDDLNLAHPDLGIAGCAAGRRRRAQAR